MEFIAWTLGVSLLITYGAARAWSARESANGIDAMQRMRAMHSETHTPIIMTSDVVKPDTSAWSPQRLAAYLKSIQQRDPPEAVLRIPSANLSVPIYEGTSTLNLNRGAGHIEGTAQIGAQGNAGVAGHRDGFFRNLKDIGIGEVMYVDMPTGTLVYRVTAIEIVDPSDVDVLNATATPTITLVTCFPFYFVGSAPKRFIVHAQRIADAQLSLLAIGAKFQ